MFNVVKNLSEQRAEGKILPIYKRRIIQSRCNGLHTIGCNMYDSKQLNLKPTKHSTFCQTKDGFVSLLPASKLKANRSELKKNIIFSLQRLSDDINFLSKKRLAKSLTKLSGMCAKLLQHSNCKNAKSKAVPQLDNTNNIEKYDVTGAKEYEKFDNIKVQNQQSPTNDFENLKALEKLAKAETQRKDLALKKYYRNYDKFIKYRIHSCYENDQVKIKYEQMQSSVAAEIDSLIIMHLMKKDAKCHNKNDKGKRDFAEETKMWPQLEKQSKKFELAKTDYTENAKQFTILVRGLQNLPQIMKKSSTDTNKILVNKTKYLGYL